VTSTTTTTTETSSVFLSEGKERGVITRKERDEGRRDDCNVNTGGHKKQGFVHFTYIVATYKKRIGGRKKKNRNHRTDRRTGTRWFSTVAFHYSRKLTRLTKCTKTILDPVIRSSRSTQPGKNQQKLPVATCDDCQSRKKLNVFFQDHGD
jgi:hypothetical protein